MKATKEEKEKEQNKNFLKTTQPLKSNEEKDKWV